MNGAALDAFTRFARAHVLSKDIDPSYPLMRAYFDLRRFDDEQRCWFTLLYLTWYHLGSAERVFAALPRPADLPLALAVQPTGTERRGFRGNTGAADFIGEALADASGNLVSWCRAPSWAAARARIERLPFGGPWSSYKWADLCKHVLCIPLEADDIGVGGGGKSAGPVPGMVHVTGEDWRRCATDFGLQRELLAECIARGVPFSGLDQLETSLCDFNSLIHGRYYVGHDIDDNMTKLAGCSRAWWVARREVFDRWRLGEIGGWVGVRKNLCSVFASSGRLLL